MGFFSIFIGNKTDHASSNERIHRHKTECLRYSDTFRPESSVLTSKPSSFGSEIVHLHGKEKTAVVCIPHKVGSHAWGKFATMFNKIQYLSAGKQKEFSNLDFESRALRSVRVVVVRHPLERLLSVYQMIFEDW